MSTQAKTGENKAEFAKPINPAAPQTLTEAYAPLDVLQRAEVSLGAIRPSDSHHLQQTAGNRAIGRKLLPRRPNYEPALSLDTMLNSQAQYAVSRAVPLQTKLTVNEPDDEYEQEADEVAEAVMRMPASATPSPPNDDGEDEQLATQIQRFGGESVEVAPDTESRISQMKGGGAPLSAIDRAFFESRMGADFSQVRIHTGAEAVDTARTLQAKAYTTGADIAFNEGAYEPGTANGRQLLAHELTHVVQQGASAPLSRKVQRRQNNEAAAVSDAAPASDVGGNQTNDDALETTLPDVTTAENGEAAAPAAAPPVAETVLPPTVAETAGQTAESTTAAPFTNLVQPGAASSEPKPETPTATAPPSGEDKVSEGERAPASAAEDPQFQAAVQDVGGAAAGQKVHDPATAKSAEAQGAATMPASEKRGAAQHVQAGMIGSAAAAQEAAAQGDSAPGFDKEAFKNAIKAKVQGLKPEDPKEMEDFEDSEAIRGAETVVNEQVKAGKTTAKGEIDDRAEESPDETAVPDKRTTPLQPNNPGPPPPAIDATRAAPKNKTADEVEKPLAEDSRSLDQKMADAEITEAQLEKSNEPQFTDALAAKRESQEHAKTAPASYREGEGATVGQAKEQAEAIKESGLEEIVGQRGESLGLLDGVQEGAKGNDEAKRQEIGEQINGIYEATCTDVEKILAELDTAVDSEFQSGAESAKQTAVDYIKKETSAYKKERYLGEGDLDDVLLGGVRLIGDTFTDMPPEYYKFYDQGFNLYVAEMDKVLDRVADIVGDKITQAKNRVEQGRQEIADFVAQQPEDLQQIAQEAAADIQSQFDVLEQNIDERQNQIVDRLAQQYSDHLQSLNAELEAMKEADKGLWGKASDMLDGVIGRILELKNQLMDIFAGASEAVTLLLADPIGFLDNLIAGIGQGLEGFIANIGDYLQGGLVDWLVGSLTGAGIQLPETWDLPGIFQLVIQIAGVSFDQIMGKVSGVLGVDVLAAWEPIQQVMGIYQESGWGGLVEYGLERIIGEENMAQLMETFEIVQVVLAGDFGRLWEIIKEYLGDLKEMIFGQIQEYLVESVIKKGITWIMSMLNPASAFVRACMMIVDVVKFFIERAEQIKSLIDAIVNAVRAIANGDVSALAQGVEQALARFIPTAIGFMASLLNLGDISQKVQDIIKGVRDFIDKAIDGILNSGPVKAVTGFIKKIIAKITALAQAGWQKAKNALGFGDDTDGEENQNPELYAAVNTLRLQEQARASKDGSISQEDADSIVQDVKEKHPIFSSLVAKQGDYTWNYDYTLQRQINGKQPREWKDEEVHAKLREIGKRYKVFECTNCAQEMRTWLTKNKIQGISLTLKSGSEKGFVVSNRYKGGNSPISLNRMHYGIEARGLVFDNLPSTGMPREEWLKDFDAIGGVGIVGEEVFGEEYNI